MLRKKIIYMMLPAALLSGFVFGGIPFHAYAAEDVQTADEEGYAEVEAAEVGKITKTIESSDADNVIGLPSLKKYFTSSDSVNAQSKSYGYFYNQLDNRQKRIYNAFLQCESYPTKRVAITFAENDAEDDATASLEEVKTVYKAVIYDHPELFWYNIDDDNSFGFKAVKTDTDGDGVADKSDTNHIYGIALWYQYDSEEAYEADQTAFNNAVSSFLSDIDTDTMPPAEIALRIHDKLLQTVSYESSTQYSHTAYGALVNGKAVCDGYTLAYKYLLEQCGIDASVQLGSTYDGVKHMWSAVQLGDSWYATDATWDDVENESSRHTYYDITSAQMSKDHVEEESDIQNMAPDPDGTYYNYPEYMYMCGTDLGTKDPDGNELYLRLSKGGSYYTLEQLPEETEYALSILKVENVSDDKIWNASVALDNPSAFSVSEKWNKDDDTATLTKNGEDGTYNIAANVTFDNGAKAEISGTIKADGHFATEDGKTKYIYSDGSYAKDITFLADGTWYTADSDGTVKTDPLKSAITHIDVGIIYNLDGGSLEGTDSLPNELIMISQTNKGVSFKPSSTFTVGVPVKEGYTFTGWKISPTDADGITVMEDGSVEVDASKCTLYGSDERALTFTAEWSKNASEEETGTENTQPSTKEEQTPDTGTTGTSSDQNTDNPVSGSSDEEKQTYKISYDLSGGTLAHEIDEYTDGDEFTIDAPVKDGYTFTGWLVNDSKETISEYKITAETSGDILLKAMWKSQPAMVTEEPTKEEQTSGIGTTDKATKQDGQETETATDNTENKSIEVVNPDDSTKNADDKDTAQTPGEEKQTYRISYDLDGGTLAHEIDEYTDGDEFTIDAPVKEGYTFTGWLVNDSKEAVSEYKITADTKGDLSLKAVWEKNTSADNANTAATDEDTDPKETNQASENANTAVTASDASANKSTTVSGTGTTVSAVKTSSGKSGSSDTSIADSTDGKSETSSQVQTGDTFSRGLIIGIIAAAVAAIVYVLKKRRF